ncbi:adenylate kinase 7-like [Anabrus simplex]|uniref:adenylate kinase 7-like n=1 Tax=Anabrus simplex TaxID=316456 RepID=UPI0035A39645
MAEENGEWELNQPEAVPVEPKKSLDIDDIVGFSAARKRLEEPLQGEQNEEPKFIPHRVFINNLDSYHARNFSEFLSDQFVGELRRAEEGGEEEETEKLEEEEEEEEDSEDPEAKNKGKKGQEEAKPKYQYEIVGTVSNPDYIKTESIKEIITDPKDRENFLPQIMKCGFIIYDITRDSSQINEAKWVLDAIIEELNTLQSSTPKAFKKMTDVRVFILISTIMTWARTKPIDPEEPDLPFTEADYRKRKPHPNYKDHITLEKDVVTAGKKYPTKFKTLIVGTGITYGAGEDIFHFLFRMGWFNEEYLPVIKPGSNLVPLIHVKDLTTLMYMLLETFPTKIKYILAVEQEASKLGNIIRAISKTLGSGAIKKISQEEAFLIPDMTQDVFDLLTVNLNMEPSYIVENMNMKWTSDLPFPENIQRVVSEFREVRGLKPIKIYLHGPPVSGKTTLAKMLCDRYKLHYLGIKEVIEEAIKNLKEFIERNEAKKKEEGTIREEVEDEQQEEEVEDDAEEEMKENIEEKYELLDEIEANLAENKGRLDNQYVLRFFKEKLLSHPVQNQGYVLDGYPKTLEDARTLIETSEEEEEQLEEEEEADVGLQPGKKMMPEFVISLESTDELLCERVMAFPEAVVQGTHYTEEAMLRRLAEFRSNNTDENTVLNFFDEMEIHPQLIPVYENSKSAIQETFHRIITLIGEPRNYGPSLLEQEARAILEEEARKIAEADELRKRQEFERKVHEEKLAKMEEWASLMDALREEEEEILAVRSLPLRHYLMKYVFPTLTRGLIEVAQRRPLDPVDYLAEYLFKENPEGKMFQPEYNSGAEGLFQAMGQFQDTLIKTDVLGKEDKQFLSNSSM